MIDLRLGSCLEVLPTLPDASVDAIVTDPPYPEISRAYGRMTEADWHEMMRGVVAQCRRILKPHGSAVFVLQPNSERVGRMRPWLWEFMAWTAREWNQVQDVWWWNHVAMPTVHCQRKYGLMRPSVKACVWLGPEDCFRDQDAVLWEESDRNKSLRLSDRCSNDLRYNPSGQTVRYKKCVDLPGERGGATPLNLLLLRNDNSASGPASHGHPAGTPSRLAEWWIKYITKPGDVVLDPFAGVGTIPLAAAALGREAIGIERMPEYFEIASARVAQIEAESAQLLPLAIGG